MNFGKRVYGLAKRIPKGKVATYGQLARLAGNPRASRAVGRYMKINPSLPTIPCHRVVGYDGKLIGYSGPGGITKKKEMLKGEGVIFKGERVDLEKSLWRELRGSVV